MGELAQLGAQLDAGLSNMWQYTYGGWDYPDVYFETWFGYYDDAPKESDFGGLRSQIKLAMGNLSYTGEGAVPGQAGMEPQNAYGNIANIGDDLTEWEGEARDSFDRNVKNQVQFVPQALYVAASSLDMALDAEAELWNKARADVKTLGNKALNAVDAADDKDSGKASFALTVIGAVGAVALGIATAGAGDVVLVAAASTALGALSIAGSGITVDWGDTTDPAKLINDTLMGLGKINEAVAERESHITTGLNKVATLLDNDLSRTSWGSDEFPVFTFKRPYLASRIGGLGSWTGA